MRKYVNVTVDVNYLDVDVDIDDVMESLSDKQLEYVEREFFDHLPRKPITLQEIEWDEVLNKLYDNRFMITDEEESLIKKITNRF
jgi:hypothetical protein